MHRQHLLRFAASLILGVVFLSCSGKDKDSSGDGDGDGDAGNGGGLPFGSGGVLVGEGSGGTADEEPDRSDQLFDPSVVRRFDVYIPDDNGPPSSWDSINDDAPTDGCVAADRPYYTGSLRVDGVTFDDIGIRVKGGCGSWRYLEEKPGLRLHLSWDSNPEDEVCPEERLFLDRKHFTLNNGVQDETALHEHLTYKFYGMVGVPSPRTASIQVYLNDEYYGIYQLIEPINRPFLKRFFDPSLGKGAMYEGAYNCDFLSGSNSNPQDGSCWDRKFALDNCSEQPDAVDDLQFFEDDGVTPQDPWKFLSALIDSVEAIESEDEYFPAIGTIIDWPAFVANWAASSILIDWDNYAQWQNNFRIYHDPESGLWYFIPWGVDQTWLDPWEGSDFEVFGPLGDIARLCLRATGTNAEGKTCTQTYVDEIYRQLGIFDAHDWDAEIDTWVARLSPLLDRDDPHRDYSYGEWQDNIETLRDFAAQRSADLRSELASEGFPEP